QLDPHRNEGTITVVKSVNNDNGGQAVASDFSLYVGDTPVTSGESNYFEPNDYTISENMNDIAGYEKTGIVCRDGDEIVSQDGQLSLSAGDAITCTVTNDDIQPKLTVVKVVDGGDASVSSFPLFVTHSDNDPVSVTSGVSHGFDAGNYTVSETNEQANYYASFSENCPNGAVSLSVGDDKTCTITNTYRAPVVLHSISGMKFNDANDNGTRDEGEASLAGWTIYLDSNDNGVLDNEETSTQTNSDGYYTFTDLSDGSYVVREVQQSGWTQTMPADNGKYDVSIDGDNPTGKDFGNHQNPQEPQQCTGSGTYTVNADFDKGSLINVNHTPSDQIQLSDQVNAFNFIWVSVSSKGTMVKINTDTGAVVGEYWTSPASQGVGNGNTSRTTVDKDGSVWVANRNGVYEGYGSVAHIGLVENGQCEDKNGNGVIDTSTGQGDIKPWADVSGDRHVATAQDECIVHYVKTSNGDARHISVTADNNVWVSGIGGRNFDLIKGGKWNVPSSGTIIRHEASVGYGGYGGLITASGIIWSTNPLIRWDTAYPLVAPNGTSTIGYSHDSYGICIDHQGNVWNTSLSGGQIRKFAPDGSLLGTFNYHANNAQGCAVDQNDNIWVAHSLWGNSVGHLLNDGTWVGNITVGTGPTGVSVDANNKVWVTNMYSQTVSRIDPALGDLGADGITKIGAVDFTSVDLGGQLYNYSDMTGSTLSGKAQSGTWTVVHDGTVDGYAWRDITWTAALNSGSLSVTVATSSDGLTFGAPQAITSGQSLASLTSRYLKIVASFDRSENGSSPVLYDLTATRECGQTPPPPPPPPVCTTNCGGGGGGSTPIWLLRNTTSSTPAVLGETLKPSLKFSKTSSVIAVFAGTKGINYSITIENTGNSSALDVKVTDKLPTHLTFEDGKTEHTWTIGELKAGEKKTLSYKVNSSADAPKGDYVNNAELTSSNHATLTAKTTIKISVPQVLGEKLPNTGFDLGELYLLLSLMMVLAIARYSLKKQLI
ncbi:MAG: SdrD B-like domain-containing protein, partial [Patescibacteria group bacterium]|nr:SdrD B-like domain-containing protein [Patescibacteria group bacterium]